MQARLAAAAELRLGDHADTEIRAVGGTVLQLTDAKAVEIVTAGLEILVVCVPSGDGVVVDAGRVQDGLPQLFHGLAGPQLREELLGPLHAGDGRDAPLVFVLDLVAVALDDRIFFLLCLGHLFLIDAAQTVRIVGFEIDAAGDGVDVVLPAGLFVVVKRAHRGERLVADVQPGQRLIVPVDDDLLRLAAVTFLDHHGHELRLVELGGDEDLLPLLDVDAALGDKARIGAQNGFFHQKFLLL